ncbi:MAG: DUF6020 family protein [Clostridiales bacterium]|nr:DUF6020 family protein [Clostridiales bacterium]
MRRYLNLGDGKEGNFTCFQDNGLKGPFAIVTIVFGLCCMLTPVLKSGSTASVQIWRFLIGMILYALILFLLSQLAKKKIKTGEAALSPKLIYVVCFCSITLVGIGYLIVYYPGTGMIDTIVIIKSEGFWAAKQHPWLYLALVQLLVKTVFALGGGYEAALVSLSVIQILLTAGIYAYALTWLYRRKLNSFLWRIVTLFYFFFPFLGIMEICLLKDVPFSLLLFAWMPILFDLYETKGEKLKKKSNLIQIFLLIFFALLRNNGIYVCFFILLCILIVTPSQWKAQLPLWFVLFAVILTNYVFESSNNITHLFKETVGIPLQQIAAVVYYDGEITEDQAEFIDQVLSLEFIKENYNPYSADTLKWGGAPLDNDFLNSHKVEFLKTWAGMLPANFGIYVKAYLQNTYGFWSLDNSRSSPGFTTLYAENTADWLEEEEIGIKCILPTQVQEMIESHLTPLTKAIGSGTAFWIFVLLLFATGAKYGWRSMIIGAPIIGNWITIMISTPVAYQWRYVYSIAMAIPFLFSIVFLNKESQMSQDDAEQSE